MEVGGPQDLLPPGVTDPTLCHYGLGFANHFSKYEKKCFKKQVQISRE